MIVKMNAGFCQWNLVVKFCGLLLIVASGSGYGNRVQHLRFVGHPQVGPYEVPGFKKFLTCLAGGIPLPAYSWMKDSALINAPLVLGTLRLDNVGESDEGSYRCIASHEYGALISPAARLKVAYINLPEDPGYDLQADAIVDRSATKGQALILDPPRVDSLPAASFQWMESEPGNELNFQRLSTSDPYYHVTSEGQLIVLDIKDQEDGKIFQVVASNPVFPNMSISLKYRLLVHKEIQYKFEIVLTPKDAMVSKLNSSAHFECVANKRSLSSIETSWYFRSRSTGQEVSIIPDDRKHLLSKYNRLLTIKHLNQSDEGTYRCEVKTSPQDLEPPLSRSAELIYQVPPFNSGFFSTSVMDVNSGEPLELNCRIVGSPVPSVTWYYNAQEIMDYSGRSLLHDNTLIISSLSRSDSGYYQCMASNNLGEAYLSYYVNVTASPPTILSMSPARDSILVRGSTLALLCSAAGVPRPMVTWYKVDHVTNETQVIGSPKLEVNRLSLEATASLTYICEARNDEGQVDRSVTVRTAAPTRVINPQSNLASMNSDSSIKIGKTLTIQCVAVFDPQFSGQVQILWSRNGIGLNPGPPQSSRGSPEVAISEETVELFSPGDAETNTAEKLKKIFGSGHEDRFWRVQGRPGPGRMLLLKKQEVVVDRASQGHGGEYKCRVFSPGGHEEFLIRVTVLGPPDQPSGVTARLARTGAPLITVQWQPGFNGNAPIRKHLLHAYIVENLDSPSSPAPSWKVLSTVDHVILSSLSSSDVMTHTFEGRPSMSYSFCVSSVNDVGEGGRSEATETILVPAQAPSGPPSNVSGRAMTEDSISMSWHPPERFKWNGPLKGYVLRYRMSEEFRRYMHGRPQQQSRKDINAFSQINILGQRSTDLIIEYLRPFTSYEFSLAAHNNKGVGPFSDPVVVTTSEGVPRIPPGHLTVVTLNSTAVNVTFMLYDLEKFFGFIRGCEIMAEKVFEDSSQMLGESQHKVTKNVVIEPPSLSSSSPYMSYFLSSPVYSFPFDNLTKFTWYQVSVSCYNSKGQGPFGNKVKVQTAEDVPDKVTSLRLDEVRDDSFVVRWSPPTDINGVLTGYLIKYWTNSNEAESHWLEPIQMSYEISQIKFETTYHIEVAASTKMGVGSSAQWSFKTGSPPEIPQPPTDIIVEEVTSDSASLIIKRRQATYIKWFLELSRGLDRTTYSTFSEEATSSLLPAKEEEEGDEATSRPYFSSWSPAGEFQSLDELGTEVRVERLEPHTVYWLRAYGVNSRGRSGKLLLGNPLETKESSPRVEGEEFCGFVSPVARMVRNSSMGQAPVTLKWMPIPVHSWNGPDSFYKITAHPCDDSPNDGRIKFRTRCPSGQSPSTFQIDASQKVESFKVPSDRTVHTIDNSEPCSCRFFQISACNRIGCSTNFTFSSAERSSSGRNSAKEFVIFDVSLLSLHPNRMLLTWKSGADDDFVKVRCIALKILYWKVSSTSEHQPTNRIRKHLDSISVDRNNSNRPRFKIVSGRDRYTTVDDLDPGTLYGFLIRPLDKAAFSRHDNSYHDDLEEEEEEGEHSPVPVYAATRDEYSHDIPQSSSSGVDEWGSLTRSWMIIVTAVVASIVIIVIVISIYISLKRSRPEKAKAQQVLTSSLNSVTYDPLETNQNKRGQLQKKRPSWKLKNNDPSIPYCAKTPPRPSPGSILYNNNNNPSNNPIKFLLNMRDQESDDKSVDEMSEHRRMTEDDYDNEAPPLPPPPAVEPYHPASIFGHTLTHLPDPIMSTSHFSTLPSSSSYCHSDDFIIEYYPYPVAYGRVDERHPVVFNHTLPTNVPHHFHHYHPHHFSPVAYEDHQPPVEQQLPPPPSQLQLEQLWLERTPGNPPTGGVGADEVRCMTIGRRYKSPKVAPYL